MTKKSLSRIKRDAEIKDARSEVAIQIKDNTIYDDIHQMYNTCGQVLVGYATSFNQLDIKEAQPRFTPEQKVKVETLVSGFNSDIHTLQNDLLNIRKPFLDKQGGETSVDKFVETVGVVDQFGEFLGRSKGVLDPVFRSLSAEVSSVRILTPEQDPNVITDVQEKSNDVPV